MPSQIAVIIPVYNTGKKKLTKCIYSVLAQTYRQFILILVDDGSTDDSGAICESFAQKDPRVLAIHQTNKGCVEARKTGIFSDAAQTAKYIAFCNSDDTLPRDALEKLVTAAEKEQADCVCGNMRRVYRKITIPSRFQSPCLSVDGPRVYPNAEILSEVYVSCFGVSDYPVSLWGKLYRTKLVTQASDHPPVVRFMGDDLSVTLRMLPETQKLVIIPDGHIQLPNRRRYIEVHALYAGRLSAIIPLQESDGSPLSNAAECGVSDGGGDEKHCAFMA